jgi:protoporphyrinogen oxidase
VSCSRRELLALLASTPLAASAASCKRKARDIPGSIRGASMPVGHRLRDATVERAAGPARRVKVAIVGGGPSGLSAAWRLERLGEKDFVVFDLESQAGGTSAFGTDGVVPYPWGAHYVPLPTRENRALTRVLDEMGALGVNGSDGEPRGREELLIRAAEERVFAEGEWHEGLFPGDVATSEDKAELARFQKEIDRWVGWRDAKGRRAFALPLYRSSDDAEVTALDRVTAAKWLDDHQIRSKLVRWYVEYACRDDYGLSLDHTSAWAMLFYFCSRVPAPGKESAPFLAWPEGNGRLVRHLVSVAGARVETGKLVTDVVPGEKGVELSALEVKTGRLVRYEAARVILAVPKLVVPRILRPWRDKPPGHLGKFSYGAWWVANVHLKQRPESPGFGPAWDNVIYDSPSLGYVVATHQKRADYGPTIWTYYVPLTDGDAAAARQRLADAEHSAFVEALLADLEPAHRGLRDAIERVDVWKWGHAMVRPVPGFVWSAERKQASEPFGRVHFAHSDLSGVGLFEEAQDHGIRAAEEVLTLEGRSLETLR